jgi:hypothetical protein
MLIKKKKNMIKLNIVGLILSMNMKYKLKIRKKKNLKWIKDAFIMIVFMICSILKELMELY